MLSVRFAIITKECISKASLLKNLPLPLFGKLGNTPLNPFLIEGKPLAPSAVEGALMSSYL